MQFVLQISKGIECNKEVLCVHIKIGYTINIPLIDHTAASIVQLLIR